MNLFGFHFNVAGSSPCVKLKHLVGSEVKAQTYQRGNSLCDLVSDVIVIHMLLPREERSIKRSGLDVVGLQEP